MTLFLIDSHVGLAKVSRERGGRICMVEERERGEGLVVIVDVH